jgi:tetraacyldisaccharide 4'-kinase
MKILLNIITFPLFIVYLLFVAIRNFFYDIKLLKIIKLSCKVVSVGNITVGGTGKTPTVIAIAKFLQQQNRSLAILSRGYGRKSTGTQVVTDGKAAPASWKTVGDEPALMAKHLTNIPIVVDENRIRGGKYLINKFNPEIIILDDGFQHRQIHRDLDIVLVNSNLSRLKNRMLGFMSFREPWKSLKRAHIIFLTKSDSVASSAKLLEKLKSTALPLFITNINPSSFLIDQKTNKIDIKEFNGKTALLFSGIGDPKSFEKTVTNQNIDVLDTVNFRDHKNYTTSDIQKTRSTFIKTNADVIITTEKDILKIDEPDLPIYSIPISMEIDEKGFETIIKFLN